jgi:hypothetical protein
MHLRWFLVLHGRMLHAGGQSGHTWGVVIFMSSAQVLSTHSFNELLLKLTSNAGDAC